MEEGKVGKWETFVVLSTTKNFSKTLNNFFEVAQLVNSEAPPKTCSANYSTK